VPFPLGRPAVAALARGRRWVAPANDPEVAAAVRAACDGVPDVLGVRCEDAGEGGLRVVLGVRRGLDGPALEDRVRQVGERLAASGVVAERVERLALTVLPA
jgi:hypothetical protein